MKTYKKNWATPEIKLMDIKTVTKQAPGLPSQGPNGDQVFDNPPS